MEEVARIAAVERETKETAIAVELNLDGSGQVDVATGIPFVDHMLDLLAVHGSFDLKVEAKGDLDVDYHHTVEDTGIVLGQALNDALGDRRGIVRYGHIFLPMDESLSRVVVDCGGRPYLVYEMTPAQPFIKDFNVGLFREFFQGFVNTARINLHVRTEYGSEPHHLIESIFKGLGRALDQATMRDPRRGDRMPSTKGSLV